MPITTHNFTPHTLNDVIGVPNSKFYTTSMFVFLVVNKVALPRWRCLLWHDFHTELVAFSGRVDGSTSKVIVRSSEMGNLLIWKP